MLLDCPSVESCRRKEGVRGRLQEEWRMGSSRVEAVRAFLEDTSIENMRALKELFTCWEAHVETN